MAINDIKSIKTTLPRQNIEEILIGLGKIKKELSWQDYECNTLQDFFNTFYEGDKEVNPERFSVQTRLKKGRATISYNFKSKDSPEGELIVSVTDNGENIPQKEFEKFYLKFKDYVSQQGLEITEEKVFKEY